MKIFNSLTRKKEEFIPISPPSVGMYTCGQTVYDYTHIGHGRKYVMDDVLRRTLVANGFKVKHVQNVTDVGHLVSDADEGEDKLEKGARKTGKTVWEVAEYFTKNFYESMDKLNNLRPDVICKATEHIAEQIAMIKKLEERGFAYDTPEAVYFDVSKFEGYGELFGQNLSEKKTAVRDEVVKDPNKKNPQDFVLWFKRVGKYKDHVMHWDSPWKDGFPGWHIECSAMSTKYLGEQFDIHTGGEDHLSVHHPNEIAQAEGATGKQPFVKYWVHHAFLMVDGRKMSKSLGNFYTIEDVEGKGFDPIALRYFYLGAHYKDPLNFTWEALQGAQNTLKKLREIVGTFREEETRIVLSQEKLGKVEDYRARFMEAVNDDLATPRALAVMWEALKSNVPSADKYDLIMGFDEILGLGLKTVATEDVVIPKDIQDLAVQRTKLRAEGKYTEADKVRETIEQEGYTVIDSPQGTKVG